MDRRAAPVQSVFLILKSNRVMFKNNCCYNNLDEDKDKIQTCLLGDTDFYRSPDCHLFYSFPHG